MESKRDLALSILTDLSDDPTSVFTFELRDRLEPLVDARWRSKDPVDALGQCFYALYRLVEDCADDGDFCLRYRDGKSVKLGQDFECDGKVMPLTAVTIGEDETYLHSGSVGYPLDSCVLAEGTCEDVSVSDEVFVCSHCDCSLVTKSKERIRYCPECGRKVVR